MNYSILTSLLVALSFSLAIAQEWEPMESLPGGNRHHPVCFSIGDKGYVLCGNADPTQTAEPFLNDFYVYDASEDSWTQLPDFPGVARGFAVGLSYRGKGYVGFGYGGNTYLDDLWEYDPNVEKWTQLPSCPCPGRTHPAFVAADGRIYVGLGGLGGANADDWWSFDIVNWIWTQEQDLPGAARHHPYYFSVEEVPYVGFGHSSNPTVIHNDFFKFDTEVREWVRLNDFPSHGRVAGTHFDLHDKGYILAGDGADHGYDEGEFWEYDPASDSWLQLPTFPADGRWAPGAFVIGETAYFTSGFARNTRVHHNDLWAFELGVTTATVNEDDGLGINVYPTVVESEAVIEGLVKGDKCRLITALGQVHSQFEANGSNHVLRLDELESGIHWLHIERDEGVETQAIIKK